MITEQERCLEDYSLVIPEGEGSVVLSGEGTMVIKVRSEDTGGAWALVEVVIPPKSAGPVLHFHTREDEAFYVLEGALLMQLGERKVKVTQGCLSYVPKGSVHTFCNPYEERARILGFISPGGFERFFEEQAEIIEGAPPGEGPDVGKLMALGHKYGGEMVGPPMDVRREA